MELTLRSRYSSGPEERLLRLCARENLDTFAPHEMGRLLEGPLQWPRLLAMATRNGVLPLISASLAAFSSRIPAQPAEIMRCACERIAAWNLRLATELVSFFELLRQSGVRAVPFKGPLLSIALYRRLSLRSCRDLDVFIDPNDLCSLMRIMTERGFKPETPFSFRSPAELIASHKDIAFENIATGVSIELHWAVCELNFDEKLHAWNPLRSESTVSVLGSPLPIHGPEHLLFLLSVHGMRHYWNSLKWVCDIDRLLRVYPELDWDSGLAFADSFRRRKTVLLAVKLARDLLGAPAPAEVLREIDNDLGIVALAKQIPARLFADVDDTIRCSQVSLFSSKPDAETDIRQKVFRIRSQDRISTRVVLCSKMIRDFLKPDTPGLNARPFGNPKFASWIIQPFRLVQAHGLRFLLRTSRQFLAAVVR